MVSMAVRMVWRLRREGAWSLTNALRDPVSHAVNTIVKTVTHTAVDTAAWHRSMAPVPCDVPGRGPVWTRCQGQTGRLYMPA